MRTCRVKGGMPLMRIMVLTVCFLSIAGLACADLEGSMSDLQNKVMNLSTPVAIILLIIAGWLKMSGRQEHFYGALIGAIILFAAPQIVDFVKGVFS